MLIEKAPQGVTAIAQQMPAVEDLGGIRRALGGSVGIGAGAVADNGRDTGMLLQPCRQSVGTAVGQQVDNPAALEIAQDRAVVMALAPCPIIDAEHPDRWDRPGITGTDTVQQRRAADRYAHGGGMAGAGVAAESQADCPMHRAQAVRLACPRAGYAGQCLGEGSPRTFTNGAAE